MIDTHVHIIDPGRFPFPVPSAGYVPLREETGTVDQLIATLDANGVQRAIAVQASVYGNDNAILRDALLRAPDRLRAVANLTGVSGEIGAIVSAKGFIGARLNLTDYAGFENDDAVVRAGNGALEAGLVVQVQAVAGRLPGLLARLGKGPIVIDHFGRPDLGIPDDLNAVMQLSRRDETILKVSGPFRLNGVANWSEAGDRLRPLVSAFAPDRVIWGSDWPFIQLAGPKPAYTQCLNWIEDLIGGFDAANAAAEQLFGYRA